MNAKIDSFKEAKSLKSDLIKKIFDFLPILIRKISANIELRFFPNLLHDVEV